jgi:ADP-ribose pyrophosphatase YjhB (NUDIX family)
VMAEWPDGLPRHDTERVVRFPHGLILYGETIEACAERLVGAQLGMKVQSVRTLKIYSYMSEGPQWHIEPLLHVEVAGSPNPPAGVSRILRHFDRCLPDGSVWGAGEFEKVFDEFFAE